MSSSEFKNAVCRICLDEDVILHWKSNLAGYSNVTYRDCYYKYTQLDTIDDDPFSSMLCQNCGSNLSNTHALILKAIDSYNFLLEVNCINSEVEDPSTIEKYGNHSSCDDDETVHEENYDTEQVIMYTDEYENFDMNNDSDTQNETEFDESIHTDDNDESSRTDIKYNFKKSVKTKEDTISRNKNENEKISQNTKLKGESLERIGDNIRTPKRQLEKKYKIKNIPAMCSFCSKILHSKYALEKHERTHLDNRERKASCPICGVKFFEKSYVKTHMQIHNDNRIKKHICEFCDKAFYEKGALNVHKRIHLGQMKRCNLCSKEYYRQIDLDIHMNSHSATIINVKAKKKSKYWVRCNYCKKNIISTSFKSHTAVHLKEPLMKCSICDRDFYRRDSCVQHVKTIHKKSSEEYNDFIITYHKGRLSHLYLEQTTEVKLQEN